jgi:hypothetical protein
VNGYFPKDGSHIFPKDDSHIFPKDGSYRIARNGPAKWQERIGFADRRNRRRGLEFWPEEK